MLRSALFGLSFAMLAGGALATESAIDIARSVRITDRAAVAPTEKVVRVTTAEPFRFTNR